MFEGEWGDPLFTFCLGKYTEKRDFMAGLNTAERVRAIVQAPIESLGLTLWDVRFQKEGADWYLRVLIDAEHGIGIDDCVNVSHLIDPLLDEHDPISCSYCLEVSSPGLERELCRPEHFVACMGQSIKVRLVRAVEGQKQFIGTLTDYNGDVTITTPEGEKTFTKSQIAKINLNDDLEA